MLPLVMFSGEIADAKVVLHKERRRRKRDIIDLRQEVYVFAGVYLFVCLCATLLKKLWINFDEIFRD